MIHACILDIHGTDGSSDCVVFTATPEDLDVIQRLIYRANRGGIAEEVRDVIGSVLAIWDGAE